MIKLLFLPTTCTQNTDIPLLLIGFGFPCLVNATLFIQGNQLPSGMPNFSVAFILHIINFKSIKFIANLLGWHKSQPIWWKVKKPTNQPKIPCFCNHLNMDLLFSTKIIPLWMLKIVWTDASAKTHQRNKAGSNKWAEIPCYDLKCATEINYDKLHDTEVFTQNYIFACIPMDVLYEDTSKSSHHKCFLIHVSKSLQRGPAHDAKVTRSCDFIWLWQ